METIAHLEANLSAAEQLGSAEEYRTWFKAYIRQLTEMTSISKLEEIFSDLLGPAHATESTRSWASQICGIAKRQLLQEALPLIASNIRLQRLASKYRESAELLTRFS
jgi:F0F1-type ATP synthase delta subunit